VLSSVDEFLQLNNFGMLSPSSRSYSFDSRANGYARGEGFGFVVIKTLSKALKDHDTIRAVIRATGTNQDGRTSTLTTPSQVSQESRIRHTYRTAGLNYSDTDFVEAHGTGTPLGDPIEAGAIGAIFGASRRSDNPVYV
jgi:acyl transferase domain-containing protein